MANIVQEAKKLKQDTDIAFVTYDNNHNIERNITWKCYIKTAEIFAQFLDQDVVENRNHKNVAIHSTNCPEWFYCALGTIISGRHFAGIYHTNSDEQCIHIIEKGDCDILVVENVELFVSRYRRIRP